MGFGVSEKKQNELSQRMKTCGILESDLKETFIRSSGPGGQHVNKTSTCVVLKHLPTNTEIKTQQGRSQLLNRYYARKRLCEILEDKQGIKSKEALKAEKIKKQKQRRKRKSTKKHSPEINIS